MSEIYKFLITFANSNRNLMLGNKEIANFLLVMKPAQWIFYLATPIKKNKVINC